MIVSLADLTIRYGKIVAVDGINASFPEGAVGLLGRNGAGKSSILRALLGVVRPQSGTMQILDLPPDIAPHELRRVVGYVPERESHIPALNGYETVRLAAELSGLPSSLSARRAHEVLYFVGLDEQRYRSVSGYSTGMKQKVKLAIALVHDPDVIFLDEPTNGLDPRGRREMLSLITDLTEKFGKSIILSSHILSDVEQVCEHVVLMEMGRVIASGSVAELTAHESRSVHLVVGGGDDQSIRQAIECLEGVRDVEQDGEGAGRLLARVADGMPAAQLFEAVRGAGGVVREFREHRRTLEEVFLGSVNEAAGGEQ